EHLEVLQHVLWDDPAEQPRVAARVIAKVANPAGMRVNQLLLECEQVLAGCDARDLASAATAAAKLADVEESLAGLKGGRAGLAPADARPPAAAGPTAFALDDWAVRKGRELLAEVERLKPLGLDAFAVADCHAAAFLPDPQLLPACAAPARRALTLPPPSGEDA